MTETYRFRAAVTVDICEECGEDIYPGDIVLRTFWRIPATIIAPATHADVTFCHSCGELWIDSQELGREDSVVRLYPWSTDNDLEVLGTLEEETDGARASRAGRDA